MHKKKLNPKKSVYEEVASANPNLTLTQVRGICGALMFEGDLAEKKISVLSGGEQGRVLFAKVIAKPANLLFLDEPSNHLDMQSIEILIDAVRNFSGGVLMVTHDENMLNHLANKLIVFQDGKVQFFERSYQEFLSEIGWSEEKKDKSSIKESTVNNKAAQGEKSGKKARSLSKDRARKLRAIERGIEKLEKEMEQLDLKKLETEAQLVQEAQNPEKVAELAKFLNELNESYEKKFELYEASQARLESFNEEA